MEKKEVNELVVMTEFFHRAFNINGCDGNTYNPEFELK